MKRFKIPTEHGRYYADHWLEIFDGGSDEWLYAARSGLCYVFINIIDMPAACGREAQELWNAEVSIVNLTDIGPEQIAQAIQSCGWEGADFDFKTESGRLALAEVLLQYGAKSPMWQDASGEPKFDKHGNVKGFYDEKSLSFRSLRKSAREAADVLLRDDEYREEQLDTRIVNRIGQTAREYALGPGAMWDKLRQIKNDPDATPEQALVLRMYQNSGQTLGAGPVPEDIMEV